MKRAHLPLILGVIAAIMLLSCGLGTRAGLWSYRTGFTVMKYAAFAAIATMILAAIMLAVPRLRSGHVVSLICAFAIGAAVFYMPWSFKQKASSVPPIHDITTDTERPPQFFAVLPLRAGAANSAEYEGAAIAAQQKQAYPDIQPVILTEPVDAAFRRAHSAAEKMGWEIVSADPATGRIEATATTTWFGFKDDVVIRVASTGQGSRIDVRSVSRVGKGDVGMNAARIRKYVASVR